MEVKSRLSKLHFNRLLWILLIISAFLERASIKIGQLNLRLSQVVMIFGWIFIILNLKEYLKSKISKPILFLLLLFFSLLIITALLSNFPFYCLKGALLIILYSTTIVFIQFIVKFNSANIISINKLLINAAFFFSLVVMAASFLFTRYEISLWGGADYDYMQAFSDDIGQGKVIRAFGFYSMPTSGGVTIISLSLLLVVQFIFERSKINYKSVLVFVAIVLGAFATYSRGYIIAFVAGFIYLLAMYVYMTGKTANLFLLLLRVFLILGILSFLFFYVLSNNEWVSSLLSKFYATFDAQSGSGLYRILVWEHLWEDFLSSPIKGNGLLYYQQTFHKDGNAESFVLELLSGGGVFTFLFFLILLIVVIGKGSVIIKKMYPEHKDIAIVFLGFFACFISMFFGYLTNPGFWTHLPWIIFGLMTVLYTNARVSKKILK